MSSSTIKKTTLRSEDLNCPSCVSKIEKELKGMEGVSDAAVFFGTGRIVVQHDPERVSHADLVKAVGSAGYAARVSTF